MADLGSIGLATLHTSAIGQPSGQVFNAKTIHFGQATPVSFTPLANYISPQSAGSTPLAALPVQVWYG